jgi:succinate dehydrogenase / fumarate reductase iron-sulfur subunit
MEVCPQFNIGTGFVGAATIAQVKLFNNHPTGKVFKEDRLRALAGDGGIQECGYAQNCVQACPKQIPLTNAISDIGRDVVVQKIKDWLQG